MISPGIFFSSSPYSPPTAGLVADYPYSYIQANYGDLDAIGTWEDSSGNGYHLTQTTAAYKPVRNTDLGVQFDGTNDFLQNLNFPSLGDSVTIYMYMTATSWAATKYLLYGKENGVGDVLGLYQVGSSANCRFSYNCTENVNLDLTIGTYYVTILRAGSSNSNVLIRRYTASPSQSLQSGWTTLSRGLNRFSLGGVYDAIGSYNSAFHIKHLRIYSVEHDSSTYDAIAAYYRTLYGDF